MRGTEFLPVSREEMRAICEAVDIPVVAIGGINAGNLPQLAGSGVDGVAVVSAIFAQPDPGAATRHLLELAGTDYRGWGMLLVVLFYGVRRVSCGTVVKRTAQAVGLAVFSIGIMGGVSIELWSLAALLPLWLYNGRRGYSNPVVQYGFYAFYPVHILVLSLIAMYRY